MEHKKDIGKAIREKLDALDKSPNDALWNAIEADLPKKKKRRFPPFWFFLTVAVIGLIAWSVWQFSGDEKKVGNQENVVGNGNVQSGASDKNGTNNPADKNANGMATSDENNVENSVDGNSINGNNADGNTTNKIGQTSDQPNNTNNSSGTDAGQNNANRPKNNNAISTKNASGGKNTISNSKQSRFASTDGKRIKNKRGKSGKNNASANETSQFAVDGRTSDGKNSDTKTPDGKTTIAGATDGKSTTVNSGIASKESADAKAKEDSIKKLIAEADKKQNEKPKDSSKTEEYEQTSGKSLRIFVFAAPTYYNTFSKISSIDKRLDTLTKKAEITFNYGGYFCFDYDEKWSFRFGFARTDLKHRTQGIPVASLNQQNYYNIEYGNRSNIEMQQAFQDSEKFDLVQDISYLEIPIEIKYKLTGDKFGIEGIGGVSTYILNQNNVTAESDNNGSLALGSTKNMYKWYLSLNAGAGFYYRFTDHLRINVEPIFKYHFRTASTALQPYSIVVLGGLEYTFNWNSRKKKAENK